MYVIKHIQSNQNLFQRVYDRICILVARPRKPLVCPSAIVDHKIYFTQTSIRRSPHKLLLVIFAGFALHFDWNLLSVIVNRFQIRFDLRNDLINDFAF